MISFPKVFVFAAPLLSLWGTVAAAPLLSSASFIVDKTDYNLTYTVGARAYVDGNGVDIASVTVSHHAIDSDSFGTWQLEQIHPGYWWSWAPAHLQMSSGPLDGSMSILVTDINGQTTIRSDFNFQPLAELELPAMTVQAGVNGYQIDTAEILNADYYNLWLWDPVERFYPSSQQVQRVSDFQTIPFNGLVDGRTYNLYLIGNNIVSGGSQESPYNLQYRSASLEYLTHSVAAVPEPASWALLMAGLTLMGAARRFRKRAEI